MDADLLLSCRRPIRYVAVFIPLGTKPFRRVECNQVANPGRAHSAPPSSSQSLSRLKRIPHIGGADGDIACDSDADTEKDRKISTSGAPLCGASLRRISFRINNDSPQRPPRPLRSFGCGRKPGRPASSVVSSIDRRREQYRTDTQLLMGYEYRDKVAKRVSPLYSSIEGENYEGSEI
jgi:hypothetical protein